MLKTLSLYNQMMILALRVPFKLPRKKKLCSIFMADIELWELFSFKRLIVRKSNTCTIKTHAINQGSPITQSLWESQKLWGLEGVTTMWLAIRVGARGATLNHFWEDRHPSRNPWSFQFLLLASRATSLLHHHLTTSACPAWLTAL